MPSTVYVDFICCGSHLKETREGDTVVADSRQRLLGLLLVSSSVVTVCAGLVKLLGPNYNPNSNPRRSPQWGATGSIPGPGPWHIIRGKNLSRSLH